jgi:hypothetical protein
VWSDFNTSPATTPTPVPPNGTITVSSPATDIFRVDFSVYYFATQIFNTFRLEINGSNGQVMIDGLSGLALNPGTATGDAMFIGLTNGHRGAQDLGPTVFAVGGPNFPASAHAMIYAVAATMGGPAVAGGTNTLIFTPIIGTLLDGNYSWIGL